MRNNDVIYLVNTKRMNMHATNLAYFNGDNTLEKVAVIQCVVSILHKKGIPKQEISNWLQISNHDVKTCIKAGINWRYNKNDNNIVNQETVMKNVNSFLNQQHKVYLNDKDINYIIELLSSKISSYQIAKHTGVSQSFISALRNNKRRISSLKLSTACKLINYYNQNKHWMSWIGLGKLINQQKNIKLLGFLFHSKYIEIIFSYKSKVIKIDFSCTKQIWKSEKQAIIPGKIKKLCNIFIKMPIRKRSWNDTQYMVKDLKNNSNSFKI